MSRNAPHAVTPPTIGRIVLYRTDGRNGLVYDLPAIVNCTRATHPGDYPDGESNPLPVPEDDLSLHLTVFTPGGFGTTVDDLIEPLDEDFPGASRFDPGSGTYVELDVPHVTQKLQTGQTDGDGIPHRSWRWPEIS